jgi:hypothetical protein
MHRLEAVAHAKTDAFVFMCTPSFSSSATPPTPKMLKLLPETSCRVVRSGVITVIAAAALAAFSSPAGPSCRVLG